jgi:hypothetical protein
MFKAFQPSKRLAIEDGLEPVLFSDKEGAGEDEQQEE